MFLNSFGQYAKAKIATTVCHQDAIGIQITKKLNVTEKNYNIFEISAQKLPKAFEKP